MERKKRRSFESRRVTGGQSARVTRVKRYERERKINFVIYQVFNGSLKSDRRARSAAAGLPLVIYVLYDADELRRFKELGNRSLRWEEKKRSEIARA